MTPATFGPTSPTQFAFYDPDGSCWRTWPAISLWGSETYSATWPRRGSMRSGACYEHPTSEHHTAGHGSSSLLGTPRASSALANETIHTIAARGHRETHRQRSGLEDGIALLLLPTPVVNDMGAGKTPELWDEWTEDMQERHGNGNGHGPSLSIEVARLLPTPRAQNGEPRNQRTWQRPLDEPQNLENALARLPTGAPTGPLSNGGNGSSDGPPPGQLTIEDVLPPGSWNG
jgi:hypothetical protein